MAYSTITYNERGNVYVSSAALDALLEVVSQIEEHSFLLIDETYPIDGLVKADRERRGSYREHDKRNASVKWRVELADGREIRELSTDQVRRLPNSNSQIIKKLALSCGSRFREGGADFSLVFDEIWGKGRIVGSLNGNDDFITTTNVKLRRVFEQTMPKPPLIIRVAETKILIFMFAAFIGIVIGTLVPTSEVGTSYIPMWAIKGFRIAGLAVVVLFVFPQFWARLYPPFECSIGQGVDRLTKIEQRRSNLMFGMVIPIFLGMIFLWLSYLISKY